MGGSNTKFKKQFFDKTGQDENVGRTKIKECMRTHISAPEKEQFSIHTSGHSEVKRDILSNGATAAKISMTTKCEVKS